MAKKTASKRERLEDLDIVVAQLCDDTEDDGPGDGVVCYYDDKMYSPGARTCQQKKIMICQDDGKWAAPEDPSDRDC